MADGAVAADGGNAERSAAAENGHAERSPEGRRQGALRLDDPFAAARGVDEAEAQLVQHLLEHLPFLGRQVSAGLLIEQRQDFDHLRGAFEVLLARPAGYRVRKVAEVD